MSYVIPDRLMAARMRYQMRKFVRDCKKAGLPEATIKAVRDSMMDTHRILNAWVEK